MLWALVAISISYSQTRHDMMVSMYMASIGEQGVHYAMGHSEAYSYVSDPSLYNKSKKSSKSKNHNISFEGSGIGVKFSPNADGNLSEIYYSIDTRTGLFIEPLFGYKTKEENNVKSYTATLGIGTFYKRNLEYYSLYIGNRMMQKANKDEDPINTMSWGLGIEVKLHKKLSLAGELFHNKVTNTKDNSITRSVDPQLLFRIWF